jgi:iron complex transport system substrate-binding protein
VALVPSVTRVIDELGEGDRLVGRTRYDTATAFADLPSVGAGMGPDYEALVALRADLVVYFVGASDPDTPAQLERLGLRRFGVRPDDLDDVVELYGVFGGMLARSDRGGALAASLRATLDSVRTASAVASDGVLGVAYLLDGDPPWAAGPATYIGQLVELAGGTLLPAGLPPLYAQISPEGLIRADIDVILLSGDSNIDPRLVEGRRLERVPDWVEVPGPEVRAAAWVIAEALHPGLARSPPGGSR